MSEKINYGVVIKKGETALGDLVNLGFPEILTDEVEKTNHGSGGWREFIPNGLMELGEFSANFIVASGTNVFATMFTDMEAQTVTEYTIEFPDGYIDPWTFNAFPKSIQVNEADAQSPDVLMAEVTFRGTGSADTSS